MSATNSGVTIVYCTVCDHSSVGSLYAKEVVEGNRQNDPVATAGVSHRQPEWDGWTVND